MSIERSLGISASALTAERLRMDVIANNIANAQTTGPKGPYKRQTVVFQAAQPSGPFQAVLGSEMRASQAAPVVGAGVRVVKVVEDNSPGQRVYEPGNPDADADGYVTYPNVNITSEMVDLMTATKAYQANVTVINATKNMALKAISIGSK
jgi:flagellar basal-body rod protein FlgC